MHAIENEFVRMALDEDGQLISFRNRSARREIVRRHELLRLILKTPDCLEFDVFPAGKPEITSSSGGIRVKFTRFRSEQGKLFEIEAQMEASLEEGDVKWKLALNNRTADATVQESYYPIFSLAEPDPPAALLNSNLVSTKIFNIPDYLQNMCATAYMAPDHKYLRDRCVYPGRSCSVNFFLIDWGRDGLYYGCHDRDFSLTFHCVEREQALGATNLFMGRLPCLEPGKEWRDDTVTTSAYTGLWTTGAFKYRAWADSWFKPPPLPPHIRTMSGWQRIILHHQYGEYLYRYNELEKLYEEGKKAGIDTLLLFGWTAEGMDSGYPVYSPDESQGGFEALRNNILKVRERGGHVILYFNGQLIDTESRFYRSGTGRALCIKRSDGQDHRETYHFFNTGNFLSEFGNKSFVVACPSSPEWLAILKRHVDLAVALGADGVFFDQIGLASYPCCDPSHGHEVPFIGLMKEKRRMLQELYEYAKQRSPGMGFGIECTNDATASYTDFFHIFGNVAQVWNPDWRETKSAPRFLSDACLFKAAFPETVISNRNLRDDHDVEFHVNRMFLLGSRSDVEIYRCRASIAAAPKYRDYLSLANALRKRFGDILFNGRFSGTQFHNSSNTLVQSNSFAYEDRLAVVLTQNGRETQETVLEVPEYEFVESGSIRSDVRFDGRHAVLPPDSLAVMVFRKT